MRDSLLSGTAMTPLQHWQPDPAVTESIAMDKSSAMGTSESILNTIAQVLEIYAKISDNTEDQRVIRHDGDLWLLDDQWCWGGISMTLLPRL